MNTLARISEVRLAMKDHAAFSHEWNRLNAELIKLQSELANPKRR